MAKGILIVVLVLFGIGYAIKRVLNNHKQKNKSRILAEKLTQDPGMAMEIAKSLNEPYGSYPYSENFNLDEIMRMLDQKKQLSNYKIDYVWKFKTGHYLVVTTCMDSDFDIGLSGSMRDVKKTFNVNFVIQKIEDKKQIRVNSEYERDGLQRSVRNAFARKLSDLIQ